MFVILLSFAFLGASLAIPNLRHFQLSFSTHFGWFHKVLSEDSDWFHHQWFFGHNDMVIFFFSSSFLCNFWLFLQQFLIWGIFNSHFVSILGDFMRYIVRILIDFIINGSLVIMTWLYSYFFYLSFAFLGCFWQYSIWGIFQFHFFFLFWLIS